MPSLMSLGRRIWEERGDNEKTRKDERMPIREKNRFINTYFDIQDQN